MSTKRTAKMKQLAKKVVSCMIAEKEVRVIVEAYQKKSLDQHKFLNQFTGEVITNLKQAYTMDEPSFEIYLSDCEKGRIESGLPIKEVDNCPLLEKEGETRTAIREFCQECDQLQSILSYDLALRAGRQDELLDINMQFVLSKNWKKLV